MQLERNDSEWEELSLDDVLRSLQNKVHRESLRLEMIVKQFDDRMKELHLDDAHFELLDKETEILNEALLRHEAESDALLAEDDCTGDAMLRGSFSL